MADQPNPEQLLRQQAARAAQEREAAERSDQEDERRQHARRSDKAEYLLEKLEEQREAPDE
ncbi:MAG: hypothetical protein JO153_02555 [Solirubrobacterales bacterium]|nr:hypothetical protein [Solirubrobacterales bacterium]MBV9915357.1 hypothetical protein [Solirubrobacterales bacterium]